MAKGALPNRDRGRDVRVVVVCRLDREALDLSQRRNVTIVSGDRPPHGGRLV